MVRLKFRWWSEASTAGVRDATLGTGVSFHEEVIREEQKLERLDRYMLSGSWSPRQFWAWVPSCGAGFSSNIILVGHSHNLSATIVLGYLTGRRPLYIKGLVARLAFKFLLYYHAVKALCGHSSSQCSISCEDNVSLCRANFRLGSSLNCLGISMGPLWPITHSDVTQYWYSKVTLVTSCPLFGNFMSIHFFRWERSRLFQF